MFLFWKFFPRDENLLYFSPFHDDLFGIKLIMRLQLRFKFNFIQCNVSVVEKVCMSNEHYKILSWLVTLILLLFKLIHVFYGLYCKIMIFWEGQGTHFEWICLYFVNFCGSAIKFCILWDKALNFNPKFAKKY